MPNLGGKSFRNRGSGDAPILQRLGSGGGGGNQILAQGRLYDLTNNWNDPTYDQVGFDGAPVFYSSGATGYSSSVYGIQWTFPGIDVNKHIIRVSRDNHNVHAGGGNNLTIRDIFMGWEIISGTTIRLKWDLSNTSSWSPTLVQHYISVEASPF